MDHGEEETKKREIAKAQIGFNYDSLEPGLETAGRSFGPEYLREEQEEDEPYTAGAELMLPPGLARPHSLRLFRAIEKTALFLADQVDLESGLG